MLTASQVYTYTRRILDAYTVVMQPLSAELDMAPNAVDILLFLANNPGLDPARDICTYRRLKPGIVSFHVDNLVRGGYLLRTRDPGDRRRTLLRCTEKACPIIEQGRALQEEFGARLLEHTNEAQRKAFFETMDIMNKNLDAILEGEA